MVIESEEDEELSQMMQEAIEDINSEMGISSYKFFALPAKNVRNMQAEFDKLTGEYKIYYSPIFIRNLEQRLGLIGDSEEVGAVVATILLHEIGHWQNGHVHGVDEQRESELQADWFAGKWSAHFDIDFEMVKLAYMLCTAIGETSTHPSRADRIEYLEGGYDNYELHHEDDDDDEDYD